MTEAQLATIALAAPFLSLNRLEEFYDGPTTSDLSPMSIDVIKLMLKRDWDINNKPTFLKTMTYFKKNISAKDKAHESFVKNTNSQLLHLSLSELEFHQDPHNYGSPGTKVQAHYPVHQPHLALSTSDLMKYTFVVLTSAGVGFIKAPTMWEHLKFAEEQATRHISSWDEYAEALMFALELSGDQAGVKKFAPLISSLLIDQRSPWNSVAYPHK